jgi:dTMP kinase
MIDEFLQNRMELDHQVIHLLFSANRWELLQSMKQKLEAGVNIICDRYWYSGVAYSYAKGLNLKWCEAPDKGLLTPDLVIVLKGNPK